MNKYVALYSRVSTDKQSTGLEAQQRSLNVYCASNQLGPCRSFSDEGISGSKSSRPALNAMLEAVKAGEVSCVVVYSFSRFARSTKHLLEALELFEKHGVAFVSLSEQLDTTTPTGRAFFTILAALSQLERELIAERVRNGLENAKAKGKKLGAPKQHADKQAVITHLASQNMSHRQIAQLAGVSQATVSRMLKAIDSETAAS